MVRPTKPVPQPVKDVQALKRWLLEGAIQREQAAELRRAIAREEQRIVSHVMSGVFTPKAEAPHGS